MNVFQRNLYLLDPMCMVLIPSISLIAEQIPVRHIEGVAFGFLVLRTQLENPWLMEAEAGGEA